MGIGDEMNTSSDTQVQPLVQPEAQPVVAPAPAPQQPAPQAAPQGQEPNVRLSSKHAAIHNGPVVIGRVKVEIPEDEATQRAGFYTEHAGKLVAQFRGVYKFKENLGDKKAQGINIS